MTDAITVIRLPVPERSDPIERVISTVGRVDLELADALHVDGQIRPYAIHRRPGALDIVACRDDLARAVLAGDSAARLVTRTRPEELAAPGDRGRWLTLGFLTPTLFHVAGLEHVLPDTGSTFGSARARWQALGWPEFPAHELRRVPVSPIWLAFRSGPGPGGQARRGFVGVVRYDLAPLDSEARAVIWTLARFAEYRGIGRHTSYGFGRVRILAPEERLAEGDTRARWEMGDGRGPRAGSASGATPARRGSAQGAGGAAVVSDAGAETGVVAAHD